MCIVHLVLLSGSIVEWVSRITGSSGLRISIGKLYVDVGFVALEDRIDITCLLVTGSERKKRHSCDD